MPKRHSLKLLFILLVLTGALALVGCSDDEEATIVDGGTSPSGATGDVVINTSPLDIDVKWTLTTPGGAVVSGENDLRLQNQESGEYTLSWPEVPGWTAPNPATSTQTLTTGSNIIFSAIYLAQPGTGMVRLSPEGISADWELSGPNAFSATGTGDADFVNLVPGDYELILSAVDGFETPEDVAGVLNLLNPLTLEAEYALPDSTLFINPLPEGTNAAWTITGPVDFTATGTGADVVEILLEGSYSIVWDDVDELTTPAEETVRVDFDDPENWVFTGAYEFQAGSVTVNGVVGGNDLPWALTGPEGAVQMGIGQMDLTGMRAGSYTVSWLPADGWAPGADETQVLGSAGNLTFAADFDGAVTVRPMPADLNAAWQLTGPGGFSLNGQGEMLVDGLSAGSYSLDWADITGWSAPDNGTGSVSADNGVVFTGEYGINPGSLFVNAQPADLDIPWTVTGPDGFEESGTGLATLTAGGAGSYLMIWEPVVGYMLPASQTMTYSGEGLLEFNTHYQMQLDLVAIPAGTFNQGSVFQERCRSGLEDLHSTTLTRPFIMKATEVTNAEYVAMAQWAYDRGYITVDRFSVFDNLDGSTVQLLDLDDYEVEVFFADGVFTTTYPDRPVKEVSWYGAVAYCDWLSMYRGLGPRAYSHVTWLCGSSNPADAAGFRLPTEAEWEYACRAGSTTAYGNDIDIGQGVNGCFSNSLETIGWYDQSSDGWSTDVGQLDANDWGLYDMHGNVMEWVNDWMQIDYYRQYDLNGPPEEDPAGPIEGDERVMRGGYFFGPAEVCRSAWRFSAVPGNASYETGFRIVLTGE